MSTEDPHGPPWWIGLTAGGAIFVFGIIGLFKNEAQTVPSSFIRFVIGPLISHDALVVPAAAVAGFLLARLLPAAVRGGIQATLAVCATVTIMAIPLLLRVDEQGDERSALPQDYDKNLAIVLALILAGGLALTLARAARRARRSGGP